MTPLKRYAVTALCCALFVATGERTALGACVGDCDGDGLVRINELVTGINIAIGNAPPDACSVFDTNGSGGVTVEELVAAVSDATAGCAPSTLDDLLVDDEFDYATARDLSIDLAVCTANGTPFPGVSVMLLENPEEAPGTRGLIYHGITNTAGRFTARIRVPARYDALLVVVSVIGIPNEAIVPIRHDALLYDFRCSTTP